jgi:CDP-diglyceride synthetase
MRKRILISILIIPVLVYVIYAPYWNGIFFFTFLLLLSAFASKEIHFLIGKLVTFRHGRASCFWFVLPPVFIIAAGYINRFIKASPGAMLLYTGAAVVAGLCVLSLVIYGLREGVGRLLIFSANFIYCGVFPLLLLLLHGEYRGFMFIYFLFLAAWVNDAAAYFIGSLFGRTRGIVRHSPNKSLEGYIGAFVITMILVNVFKLIIRDGFAPEIVQTNILGFCISLTAPMGDLGESFFKRKTGVKDSSAFLPGLGGVLDIFDSVLLSVPLYYILVQSII